MARDTVFSRTPTQLANDKFHFDRSLEHLQNHATDRTSAMIAMDKAKNAALSAGVRESAIPRYTAGTSPQDLIQHANSIRALHERANPESAATYYAPKTPDGQPAPAATAPKGVTSSATSTQRPAYFNQFDGTNADRASAASTPSFGTNANKAVRGGGPARNPAFGSRVLTEEQGNAILGKADQTPDLSPTAGTGKVTQTQYGTASSRMAKPDEKLTAATVTADGVTRDAPAPELNWQQKLVKQYPNLADATHDDNKAFVKAHNDALQAANGGAFDGEKFADGYFKDQAARVASEPRPGGDNGDDPNERAGVTANLPPDTGAFSGDTASTRPGTMAGRQPTETLAGPVSGPGRSGLPLQTERDATAAGLAQGKNKAEADRVATSAALAASTAKDQVKQAQAVTAAASAPSRSQGSAAFNPFAGIPQNDPTRTAPAANPAAGNYAPAFAGLKSDPEPAPAVNPQTGQPFSANSVQPLATRTAPKTEPVTQPAYLAPQPPAYTPTDNPSVMPAGRAATAALNAAPDRYPVAPIASKPAATPDWMRMSGLPPSAGPSPAMPVESEEEKLRKRKTAGFGPAFQPNAPSLGAVTW